MNKANDSESTCAKKWHPPLLIFSMTLAILAAGGAFGKAGPKPQAQPEPTQLALADFLAQVAQRHQGYKAAEATARAAKLQAGEGKLIFRPNLIGNATANAEGQSNPFDTKGDYQTKNYSLGVGQATNFGLSGSLTLNRSELSVPLSGVSGAPASVAEYDANWAQLEVSQSLWKNWAGRELRAQSELLESGALAKAFGQSFLNKTILLEAEAAYWSLVLARERVQVQKDAVDRAQRMGDWANRRLRLQLSDRAEFFQTSTAIQARKLDLRTAEDAERSAAQAFNSSRGLSSNVVSENLSELTPELIAKWSTPVRSIVRDDVKAAELQAKASAANARLSGERNKPTLDIFAQVPLNEPDAPTGALSAVLPPSSRPSTTIGIRLTAPLDFVTQSRASEGYNVEANAAEMIFQRKVFEEERDWADLTSRFSQAQERLKLFVALESVQKDKLSYERERQQRGRSTLQQVLIYESDLQTAQLGRLGTLAEILSLNANMKLYGVSYGPPASSNHSQEVSNESR